MKYLQSSQISKEEKIRFLEIFNKDNKTEDECKELTKLIKNSDAMDKTK